MGATGWQKEGEHTRAKSFASPPELMMSPRCTKPLLDEKGPAYLQIVALLVTCKVSSVPKIEQRSGPEVESCS